MTYAVEKRYSAGTTTRSSHPRYACMSRLVAGSELGQDLVTIAEIASVDIRPRERGTQGDALGQAGLHPVERSGTRLGAAAAILGSQSQPPSDSM